MIAARITRRILRKIAKPVALWIATSKIRRAEARVVYFERLLHGLVPHDLKRRVVELIAERNRIQNW